MTTITSGQSNLTYVHSHEGTVAGEGTVAPAGKYDWTCASFRPSESIMQMANQSDQPFLHSSWHGVIGYVLSPY